MRHTDNNAATVPYEGRRGVVNCTVNHPDVVKGMAARKDESAEAIREYAKHSRHKNAPGERKLKHIIIEEVHKNGLDEKVKTETTTKRRNH